MHRSRQGAAFPAIGCRSLLAAVLLALLSHSAEFSALLACSPPRHQMCHILRLALNVPLPPSTRLGSWLPTAQSHEEPPVVVIEAVSRFAQGMGEGLGVSSPMLHLSPIEVCCPWSVVAEKGSPGGS